MKLSELMQQTRKIYLLILFLTTITFHSFSQTFTSVSGNSRIFAVCKQEGREKGVDSFKVIIGKKNVKKILYTYHIDVYDLKTNNKFSAFKIKYEFKSKMDTMFLSPTGKSLYMSFPDNDLVCDVKAGRVISYFPKTRHLKISNKKYIKYFSDECIFTFDNFDNQFLLAEENKLNVYDAHSGGKIFSYRNLPTSSKIVDICFSENDKYIVVLDDKNTSYLWKSGNPRLLKRFYGSVIRFSSDAKSITIGRKTKNNYSSYVYTLPKLKRVKKFSSYKLLKEITADIRGQSKENTPDFYADIKLPVKVIINKSTVSPNGKYLILALSSKNNIQSLAVVDNSKAKAVFEIVDENKSKEGINYFWANDSILFLDVDHMNKRMFNVESQRYVDEFNYAFDFNTFEYTIIPKTQIKKRVISPDLRFVVLENNNFLKKGIYAKPAPISQDKSFIENVDFIQYTPDSKLIIARDKNKKYGFVNTSAIVADFGEKSLEMSYFTDTLQFIVENIIGKDGVVPQGFYYPRFTRSRHISEIQDSLSIVLKTISQSDSFAEIKLHIMDKRGVYYFGGGEEDWKNIWCNLIVQKPNGETIQLTDFEIYEYSEREPQPNAISLVLDHSGSMGEERAKTLQRGVVGFIDSKSDEDAVAVIKYDDRVGVDAQFSNNKKALFKEIGLNGLYGYGGGTALLDGVAVGISKIKDTRGFQEKSVILFTDGNENASFSSKRDVILKALENNIKVHTIGFGDYISEDYLKAIADYTEGSYYRIYETGDLEWILGDIYKKVKNYYGIRINMEIQGDYVFFLKVCPPNGVVADTLTVKFSYVPDKINKIKSNPNYDFNVTFKEEEIKQLEMKKFEIKDITDFDQISIGKKTEIDTAESVLELDETSLIEHEFDQLIFPDIKFVFDKTDIVKGTAKELINVITFMKRNKGVIIEIAGHTDERGQENYNIKLSQKRSEKVKEMMVKKGISADRIMTTGYGESAPIDVNSNDKGRQKNRRVEFRILED